MQQPADLGQVWARYHLPCAVVCAQFHELEALSPMWQCWEMVGPLGGGAWWEGHQQLPWGPDWALLRVSLMTVS